MTFPSLLQLIELPAKARPQAILDGVSALAAGDDVQTDLDWWMHRPAEYALILAFLDAATIRKKRLFEHEVLTTGRASDDIVASWLRFRAVNKRRPDGLPATNISDWAAIDPEGASLAELFDLIPDLDTVFSHNEGLGSVPYSGLIQSKVHPLLWSRPGDPMAPLRQNMLSAGELQSLTGHLPDEQGKVVASGVVPKLSVMIEEAPLGRMTAVLNKQGVNLKALVGLPVEDPVTGVPYWSYIRHEKFDLQALSQGAGPKAPRDMPYSTLNAILMAAGLDLALIVKMSAEDPPVRVGAITFINPALLRKLARQGLTPGIPPYPIETKPIADFAHRGISGKPTLQKVMFQSPEATSIWLRPAGMSCFQVDIFQAQHAMRALLELSGQLHLLSKFSKWDTRPLQESLQALADAGISVMMLAGSKDVLWVNT